MDNLTGVSQHMSRKLTINGQDITLEDLSREGDTVRFTLNGTHYCFTLTAGVLTGSRNHHVHTGRRLKDGSLPIAIDGTVLTVQEATAARRGGGDAAASPIIRAPMTGMVQQVLVHAGERVRKGTPLVVMEAMKLQLRLTSHHDGTVEAVETAAGALVSEGQVLVRITPDDA